MPPPPVSWALTLMMGTSIPTNTIANKNKLTVSLFIIHSSSESISERIVISQMATSPALLRFEAYICA